MDHTTRWTPQPMNIMRRTFSSHYALENMVRTGAHRLAIVNDLNRVVGIMTQSMLVSMIRQNMYLLPSLSKTAVEDFDDLVGPVYTVAETELAINGFNQMLSRGVSGLAVVDEEKTLGGALSVRDLRGVGTDGEHFSRLFLPIKDYKAAARKDYPFQAPRTHYSRRMVPVKGLYCTPTSTFQDVITLMVRIRTFVYERDFALLF